MDFLASYITNVHVLDEVASIYYCRYGISGSIGAGHGELLETASSIRNATTKIRERGGLAAALDMGICIFGRSETQICDVIRPYYSCADASDWLKFAEGLEFRLIGKGLLNSSIILSDYYSFADVVSATSSALQCDQGAQDNNEVTLVSTVPSPVELLALFISTLIQNISFGLAGVHNMLPLSSEGLLSPPKLVDRPDSRLATWSEDGELMEVTMISVQLTVSGRLLFSMTTTQQNDSQILARDMVAQASGEPLRGLDDVRIIPTGKIAKLHSPASSKRMEWREGNDKHRWRDYVRSWLRYRGFSSISIDGDAAWTRLLLPVSMPMVFDTTKEHSPMKQDFVFEWPEELCLSCGAVPRYRRVGKMFNPTQEPPKVDFNLRWFATDEQAGYQDPLDIAHEWLAGRAARGKDLVASELHTAEEDLTKSNDDFIHFPSEAMSPPGHRTTLSVDSQAVGPIYPTPPDGQLLHATSAASPMDAGNACSPQQSWLGQPLKTFREKNDCMPTLGADQQKTTDQLCMNTLYGEDDDEDFAGAGVTEMDFNFFDEPDPDVAGVTFPSQASELHLSENAMESAGETAIARDLPTSSPIIPMHANRAAGGVEPTQVRLDEQMLQLSNANGSFSSSIIEETANELYHVRQRSQTPLSLKLIGDSPLIDPNLLRMPTDVHTHDSHVNRVLFPSNATSDNLQDKYDRYGRFYYSKGDHHDQEPYALYTPQGERQPSSIPKVGWQKSVKRHRPQPRRSKSPERHANMLSTSLDCSMSDSGSEYGTSAENSYEEGVDAPVAKRMKPAMDGRYRNSSSASVSADSEIRSRRLSHDEDILSEDQILQLQKSTLEILFDCDTADWWLPDYSSVLCKDWPSTVNQTASSSLHDYVTTAQLLTRMSINDIFIRWSSIAGVTPWDSSDGLLERRPRIGVDVLAGFSTATILDLESLAALEGGSLDPNLLIKAQSKGVSQRSNAAQRIFDIPPPFVRVQRNDAGWEVLPSALPFWEILGLGPANGFKDVLAWCIYPFSESIEGHVLRFLETLQSTYQSCKLGHHIRAENFTDYTPNGLVAVRLSGEVTVEAAIQEFGKACMSLIPKLQDTVAEDDNIVVYLINPFDNPRALQALCICFLQLKHAFAAVSVASRSSTPNIILQIVPIKLIATVDAPVFLNPSSAALMARQIYDQCPVHHTRSDGIGLRIPAAASIELAETPPSSIDFRLVETPPSNLLYENSCLHVAYSESSDRLWITTAWTDSTGKHQATAAYSMHNKRTFAEVAREIWETTLDIIQPRKVTWRLFLAKTGIMAAMEKSIWIELAAATTQNPVGVSILSVTTQPALTLAPKLPAKPPFNDPPVTELAATSPPQAQPNTPAPTPPATTPAGATASLDADASARLHDITDESWGVVLADRLNVFANPAHFHHALASGYLLKRSGDSDLDPPVLMEVNLMHQSDAGGSSLSQTSLDGTLREVLVMYRGLGLLARARGVEDPVRSVAPWHVAVAMRAAEVLSVSMGPPPGGAVLA